MTTEYSVRLDRTACDGVFACLVRDDRFVEAEDGLATIDGGQGDFADGDLAERDETLVATFDDEQQVAAEQAADACPLDAIDVQVVTTDE